MNVNSASSLVGGALGAAETIVRTVGGGGLQAARERCGFSRAELAYHVQITRQSVYHYERGLRTPRGLIALRYVEVLGLDR